MNEIWKDIPSYPNYEASNKGNIRNKKNNKIFKPTPNNKGYLYVTLECNKAPKSVHRIIGKLFVSNPENKKLINHKDAIKTNNEAINLEWVTAKENSEHAVKLGLYSKIKKKGTKLKGQEYKCKKIKSVNINTNEIIEYKSIKDAVLKNYNRKRINNAIKTNTNYKNCNWFYA